MTTNLDAPLLFAAAAAALLGLNAWEAEAGRHSARQRPLLAGRHDALEVRLAAWCFFATLIWLSAAAEKGPILLFSWSLPLGLVIGFLLVFSGWSLGRNVPYPSFLRWPIAPYHGLAGLMLWIWSTIVKGGRARAARNGAEEQKTEELNPAHQGVRDLADSPLEELMIPRSQVCLLEGARTVIEILPAVRREPHALYPVYGDSIDQPLGVVHILDLAGAVQTGRLVRDLVLPAPIVPETMKGLDLLDDLGGAPIPAALVVDEFGGMAGLVTVEDLVEVLVGDLVGEHDLVRTRILPLEADEYRVEGTTTIEEFNSRFGEVLPEGDYETVAGLVLDSLGRIPQVGETVAFPNATLEVLERTERRILWLKAALRGASAAAPSSARPPRWTEARPG